jgi:hypothetical protein
MIRNFHQPAPILTQLTRDIRATLIRMSLDSILSTIDAELSRLQQARTLIAGSNANPASAPSARKTRKRVMSEEARKRIGDAQRKRWAKQKRATAKR